MGLESFRGNYFSNAMRRTGLVFGAGLIVATASCSSDQKPRLPTPSLDTPSSTSSGIGCNSTSVEQVKIGIVHPQDYIQIQYKCSPEVIKAEKSGLLKGFLYQPSDRELEAISRDLFSTKAEGNEQTLQYLVNSSIDAYKNPTRERAGVIFPGIIGAFGQRLPTYIIFTEELFSSPLIKNNADMESILKHEIIHAQDWHNGITLGDIYLSYDTISPQTFSINFLQELMELRATYGELKAVFKKRAETGKASISPAWLSSQAANYSEHFSYVKQAAMTDLEKKVSDFQLQEFRGITPEETADSIQIKFDLFGQQGAALFKRTGK